MSIKETLERFDEKELGQLDFCGNDDHECECSVKEEEIKQFITEEIKLAREETIREVESKISKIPKIEMTFSDIKDMLNKLKKYETIRNI